MESQRENAQEEQKVVPIREGISFHKLHRRIDWNQSHQAIEAYVYEHLRKFHVMPSDNQIVQGLKEKGIKISKRTVFTHRQEINLEAIAPMFQSLTPKVLEGLAIEASKGRPAAVKLWMQIVEGWKAPADEEKKSPADQLIGSITERVLKMSDEEKRKRLAEIKTRI